MKSAVVVSVLFATGLLVTPAAAASNDDFEPAECIDNGGIGADPFVDVAADAFSRDAVAWAFDNHIVEGADPTHFSPDGLNRPGMRGGSRPLNEDESYECRDEVQAVAAAVLAGVEGEGGADGDGAA